MTAQPSILVRGEATLEVDPEIAVVSVTVMGLDPDRSRALDLFAKRNAQVIALVQAQGEAVEKIESGSVNVNPEFASKIGNIHPEFKPVKIKERIAGYVARGSVSVTVGDFTVLADLVAALASEEMVAVTGPSWGLRPDSPVHRQARLTAARDALRRAREYAEAFGGQVTGLAEVADVGLLADGEQPVRTGAMAARAPLAYGAAAKPEEFDFEPAKQTVRAQVQARFTMTPPDFGT